jgi:uncharacterized protein YjdB
MDKVSKKFKRALALMLSFVMVVSVISVTPSATAEAASKKVIKSLSVAKTATVNVGSSKNVKATVKTTKSVAKGDLKVTVKSSNKNVVTAKVSKSPSKKGKSGQSTVKLTGKKAGTATVTVTTKATNKKNKKVSKKIKVTVKGKANGSDNKVAVTKVTVTAKDTTLYVNDSTQLTATVEPSNATNKTITWKSSDTSVATVDATGKVTGVKEGKVTISATADGKTGSVALTVLADKDVAVTSVTATADVEQNEKGVYTISVDSTAQITTVVTPSEATDQKVSYTSSDEKLIKVDANGKVTAIAEGNATITVTAGGKSATLNFNIVTNEYSIALDKVDGEILCLRDGYNTSTITATVVPSTGIVEWTASPANIVEIDVNSTNKATITAVGKGDVTITAKIGNATKSIKYTVMGEDEDYVIFTGASGMATGSFEFTVDIAWKFDKASVKKSALEGSKITLTNADDPTKVFTATFQDVNGETATYAVDRGDFVVSGKFGAQDGTYTLTHGTGVYTIEADSPLTVSYTEQKNQNRIAGRVTDEFTGEAIAGVKVKTDAGFTAYSDENGYYDVSSTNGDTVGVTFSKEGYFEEKSVTTVGNSRTSVINQQLDTYNQDELMISGTIRAVNSDSEDVTETGFKVELQELNSEGEYETISTINTNSGTDAAAQTLTYQFGNVDSGVVTGTNKKQLPSELSIKSTSTYQIVITNGIAQNKTNPVYTKTVKSVTTSTTARTFTVDLATMTQVTPLSSLKIAKETIGFASDSDMPTVADGLTFSSIKLIATNGTTTADVTLASATNVSIDVKVGDDNKHYTNTSEIDLLRIFGTQLNPAKLELPKTDNANHYYLVFEQAQNAYATVEVVVTAAGQEVVIDELDSFQKGYTGNAAAGYELRVGYDATDSANAINTETNLIYAIDGDKNKIGNDANNLKVDYNIYQVVDGVKVLLGTDEGANIKKATGSSLLTAGGSFEKLSTKYTYVAVPDNDYLQDVSIDIVPNNTNSDVKSVAVANVGSVVVPLSNNSKLNGTVFVNSIKLVDADGKVVATRIVNDDVQIEDNALTVDVSEEFAKIPAGTYKIVYDISNYETLTTEASYKLVGFEQADLEVKDDFKILSNTGVQGKVLCDNKMISSSLYAILINEENKIVAAQSFNNSSYALINGQDGNEIVAGTYRLVIRGQGYNTYSEKITLQTSVTKQNDDITLSEGARGNIQLYAKCNSLSIASYNAVVTAYDNYYVEPTLDNCTTSRVWLRIRGWNARSYGAYAATAQDNGTYYETGAYISKGPTYTVEVTGALLETTKWTATLSSNDVGNKVTLTDKVVNYVAPAETMPLELTYGVTGGNGNELDAGVDYIVLTTDDGTYVDTIEVDNTALDSASTRTTTVPIPLGFTGYLTVYATGSVTTGSLHLDNYNAKTNGTAPCYATAN